MRLCLVRDKENRNERKEHNLGKENTEEREDLSLVVFGVDSLLQSLQ